MIHKVDKARAICLRKQGNTYKQIAQELNCSVDWCKRNLKDVKWKQTKKVVHRKSKVKNYNKFKCPAGYYVYCAVIDQDIVYIGKGKDYRYEHPYSGCSHVYEMNKLHFQGVDIDVFILYDGLSDEEAKRLEQQETVRVRPRYNIRGLVMSFDEMAYGVDNSLVSLHQWDEIPVLTHY